jgi:hypothetical protein
MNDNTTQPADYSANDWTEDALRILAVMRAENAGDTKALRALDAESLNKRDPLIRVALELIHHLAVDLAAGQPEAYADVDAVFAHLVEYNREQFDPGFD